MRLTLDTNVLVYASHDDDPKHHAATGILQRAARADTVLTLQSLGELVHSTTRQRKLDIHEAAEAVVLLQRLFPIASANSADLAMALALTADHGIQIWDSLLLATAKRAGCTLLLSEDFQDGRQLEGVTVLDPFNPENERLINLALPGTE